MLILAPHPHGHELDTIEKAIRKIGKWRKGLPSDHNRAKWRKSALLIERLTKEHNFLLGVNYSI